MPEPTKPMNMTQARAEAKRRWGIWAFAQHNRIHKSPDGKGKRWVGVWVTYPHDHRRDYKSTYGWGDTWEEAFAQATEKGH